MKIFKFIVVMVVVVSGLCGVDAFAQAMQSGPSPLSTVLNESGRYTYSSRMKALVGMGDSLSVAECDALIGFLHRKAAGDALDAGDLNTLKNDITNLLRKQPPVCGCCSGYYSWSDCGGNGGGSGSEFELSCSFSVCALKICTSYDASLLNI